MPLSPIIADGSAGLRPPEAEKTGEYREAHLSTLEDRPQTAAWLSRPHGDRRRPQGDCGPEGQGPEAPVRLIPLWAEGADVATTRMSQPPRLKKRAEFLAVAGKGAKAPMPGLVLQLMPREDDAPFRVGFTVTKKVGNAVVRNRTKRRLREAVRHALDPEVYRGFDMVVIGRGRTAERPFCDLIEDLRKAVAKTRRATAAAGMVKGGLPL
jgi:ribonuclease P protein component